MKRLLAVTVLLVGLTGCGVDWTTLFGWNNTGDTGEARLKQFTSESELKEYLVNQASPRNTNVYAPVPTPADASGSMSQDNAAPTAMNEGTGNVEQSSDIPDYSTTTEQEEGVHEADIVKSDGNYLYILSDGILHIVDANPAIEMSEVSTVDIEGWGNDMYLVGDKVVILSQPDSPVFAMAEQSLSSEIASFWIFEQTIVVTVIDVTDRAAPAIKSRSEFDGWVNSSRMIGTKLYMVITNDLAFLNRISADDVDGTTTEVELADLLPNVTIEVDGKTEYSGDVADYSEYYYPEDSDGLGFSTIVTMDIDSPQNYTAQSVVGYPSNIYASTEALYITDTDYTYDGTLRQTTDIYKFSFTDSGTELVASGTVPGRVLNQYSMSEYNGYLRVATTTVSSGRWLFDDSDSSNAVYVLKQNGDALELAGKLEGLAPGESIYSARFLGDKGYLVTFEQIDPLFTLDLSDPTNPVAVGELKVPGFSTFITPLGENHLLTIGQDTNDDNGWTFAEGVRLSIFDISDFANPTLAHYEVIGETGAYSEALYNPKAFTLYTQSDLIAFPVEIYDWNYAVDDDGLLGGSVATETATTNNEAVTDTPPTETEGSTDVDEPAGTVIDIPAPNNYFVGLYVYKATAENGFELIGRISTATDNEYCYYCGPSFTRGAFIDDNVYAMTSEGVKAASVSAIETILSTVEFEQPEYPEPVAPEPVEKPDIDNVTDNGNVNSGNATNE